MALDTSGTASQIASKLVDYSPTADLDTPDAFLAIVNPILDASFQAATPSMGNIDITTPAGSLNITMTSPEQQAEEIGNKCAAYWENTVNTSGSPQSCGGIDSVSNDASKIASMIKDGLLGLYSGSELTPHFYDFVRVIHDAIKTIQWTVNESDGTGCSATLTVTVS